MKNCAEFVFKVEHYVLYWLNKLFCSCPELQLAECFDLVYG